MPVAFYFVGFNHPEQIKLILDGREKVYLASSKTGFIMKDISGVSQTKGDNLFYDSVDELQKALTLSEESFELYVKLSFARVGYKFVKKQNE